MGSFLLSEAYNDIWEMEPKDGRKDFEKHEKNKKINSNGGIVYYEHRTIHRVRN